MKALLLVAHPDDEAIFAGAVMLARPNWSWTIQCATYEDGHARGTEFAQSVQAFRDRGVRVQSEMLGLHDRIDEISAQDYQDWAARIEEAKADFDVVYTHNRRGDYGHLHHMAVNAAAHSIYTVPVWEFYYPGITRVGMQHRGTSNVVYQTTEKSKIIEEVYGHRIPSLLYHLPEVMHWHITQGKEQHTCRASS